MCDVNEDKLAAEQLIAAKKQILSNKTCMKCKENKAMVVVRAHDPLCRDCFLIYTTHKFRSTLGKARLIQANEKVLIAVSGGSSSLALLHFVSEALSEKAHKRLRFHPGIIYIDESSISNSEDDICSKLQQIADSYGYPLFKVPIYQNNTDNSNDTDELKRNFLNSFSSIKTLTAKNEYLYNKRLSLIVSTAKNNEYKKIMFGENASRLSMKLLNNVAQGRGSTIGQDIGVADYRHDDVILIRPIREFLPKEIIMYNRLKKIETLAQVSINTKTNPESCLQRQTEEFINGLQAEFPSTINTVFRTGEKLSSAVSNEKLSEKCIMCKSPIDLTKQSDGCIKEGNNPSTGCCGSSDECSSKKFELTKNNILQLLCYGCKLTFKDMENDVNKLSPDMINYASSQLKREKMKESIQDFLLE